MNRARTIFGGNLYARSQHGFDFSSNIFGQNRFVVLFCHQSNRAFPVQIARILNGIDDRPQIHPPRFLRSECKMLDLTTQSAGKRVTKSGIDKIQNCRCRPKGILQVQALKTLAGRAKPFGKRLMFFIKRSHVRALKRIDRLLFVAHHEQRSTAGPRAFTCGKF